MWSCAGESRTEHGNSPGKYLNRDSSTEKTIFVMMMHLPAERWPYEPLAALELRDVWPNGVGLSCREPSELRVRLSMSRPHSENGEWDSALLRPPLPRMEGRGLVSREPARSGSRSKVNLNEWMNVGHLYCAFPQTAQRRISLKDSLSKIAINLVSSTHRKGWVSSHTVGSSAT